jgi:5'(3')-deoxyribonucleotidase
MNSDTEIQKLLKTKYLKPGQLNEKGIGIKHYAGTQETAYYEIWGENEIFRLLVVKPSSNLYLSYFVDKMHLLVFLIEEDDRMQGGLISLKEDFFFEAKKIFPHLNTKSIRELQSLWSTEVKKHYRELPTELVK